MPFDELDNVLDTFLWLLRIDPMTRIDISDLEIWKEISHIGQVLVSNVVGLGASDEQGWAQVSVDPGVELPVSDVPFDDSVVQNP